MLDKPPCLCPSLCVHLPVSPSRVSTLSLSRVSVSVPRARPRVPVRPCVYVCALAQFLCPCVRARLSFISKCVPWSFGLSPSSVGPGDPRLPCGPLLHPAWPLPLRSSSLLPIPQLRARLLRLVRQLQGRSGRLPQPCPDPALRAVGSQPALPALTVSIPTVLAPTEVAKVRPKLPGAGCGQTAALRQDWGGVGGS